MEIERIAMNHGARAYRAFEIAVSPVVLGKEPLDGSVQEGQELSLLGFNYPSDQFESIPVILRFLDRMTLFLAKGKELVRQATEREIQLSKHWIHDRNWHDPSFQRRLRPARLSKGIRANFSIRGPTFPFGRNGAIKGWEGRAEEEGGSGVTHMTWFVKRVLDQCLERDWRLPRRPIFHLEETDDDARPDGQWSVLESRLFWNQFDELWEVGEPSGSYKVQKYHLSLFYGEDLEKARAIRFRGHKRPWQNHSRRGLCVACGDASGRGQAFCAAHRCDCPNPGDVGCFHYCRGGCAPGHCDQRWHVACLFCGTGRRTKHSLFCRKYDQDT